LVPKALRRAGATRGPEGSAATNGRRSAQSATTRKQATTVLEVLPPRCTPEDGRDPVLLEHRLHPRHPQDEPVVEDQLVVAPAVGVDGALTRVELVAVGLDDDPQVPVDEVGTDATPGTRSRTWGTSRSPGTSIEMARMTDSKALAGRSLANQASSIARSRPRPGSWSEARIRSD
jgi:hypothetical protein